MVNNVKKTAIGLLPTSWEVRRIKEVCDTTSGGTPSRSKTEYYDLGTIPWIKTGELNHKYIFDTEEKITEVALQQSSAKLVPENSVLMAMYGATIGKTSITKVEATTNQACCVMISKGKLEPEFLYYVLSLNKEKIIALGAGGAQPNISQQIIREIEIPLPSQKEQQKIVTVLSNVDRAIEKTGIIIKQTEEVKKGLMRQLLTKGVGHTKFKKTAVGEIPEEWKLMKQSDFCTFYNGRAYKQSEFREAGTPVIRIQNLTGGKNYVFSDLILEENKYVESGDLIYAWSATFGPYIWEGPKAIYHYHIWKIICNENLVDKQFLFYRLHYVSSETNNQKNGSVFAHLTKSFMENYMIALPPLKEQRKIVSILSAIDQKISLEKTYLNKLKYLKKGLMQSLLTGKVRVNFDETEGTQV